MAILTDYKSGDFCLKKDIEYLLKFGFISDLVETYNIFCYPWTPTYTSYSKIY